MRKSLQKARLHKTELNKFSSFLEDIRSNAGRFKCSSNGPLFKQGSCSSHYYFLSFGSTGFRSPFNDEISLFRFLVFIFSCIEHLATPAFTHSFIFIVCSFVPSSFSLTMISRLVQNCVHQQAMTISNISSQQPIKSL